MTEKSWETISSVPEDVVVETKIDNGQGPRDITPLRKKVSRFFSPDLRMYVYYTPTHWR